MGQDTQNTEAEADFRIDLASRETVQTRALEHLLSRELGAHCVLHDDLGHCLDVAILKDVKTVLLLDCSVYPPSETVTRLGTMSGLPSRLIPALINLEPYDALEHEAVQVGIRGLFYTDQGPEQLIRGIRALAAGEIWISRQILLNAVLQRSRVESTARNGRAELTQREIEILALMVVGARNEDIANKLFISTNTVKTHIYNIYKKIRVPNRTQAALWAAKHL